MLILEIVSIPKTNKPVMQFKIYPNWSDRNKRMNLCLKNGKICGDECQINAPLPLIRYCSTIHSLNSGKQITIAHFSNGIHFNEGKTIGSELISIGSI